MDLGQRIRTARKKANLTQAQLAEKIGAATITVRQYELGKRQPRIEQIQDIAYALNVEFSDLFGSDYKIEDATKPDRVALRKAFGPAGVLLVKEHITEADLKFMEQINMLTLENKEKIRELVNLYLDSQNKGK